MRLRFFLSLLGLGFGGSILVISLFSATQVSSNGGRAASESKLYFSQQILPDHSLYKVLMAMDRIQLETATPQEQIYMRVEYANRRLDYAKSLLDKDKEDLAMTTLLKSQQYLDEAIQSVLKQEHPQSSLKERLAKSLDYHSEELKNISPKLTDSNRAIIDRVIIDHNNLHANLTSQVTKN